MSDHVVVDGSNMATEGRNKPSLAQLRDAVSAYQAEHPDHTTTVVVDATFPNRIPKGERNAFEKAIDDGELLTPPAGVVGRGDAFILQVADKADAVVLSNDSFQEFHGTYPWLLEQGRLVGGKPVPGVGWVFVDRIPVQGPVSRRAVRDARRTDVDAESAGESAGRSRSRRGSGRDAKRTDVDAESAGESAGGSRSRRGSGRDAKRTDVDAESAGETPSRRAANGGGEQADRSRRRTRRATPRDDASADADNASKGSASDAAASNGEQGEATGQDETEGAGRTRTRSVRRRRGSRRAGTSETSEDAAAAAADDTSERGSDEMYNERLPFVQFVASHLPGSTVTGTVDRFSSHGAYVMVGDVQCYLPLKSMGDPAPRRARDVVKAGEERRFVVEEVDPGTRGIDLALPGFESHRGADAGASEPEASGEKEEPVAQKRSTKASSKKKAAAKRSSGRKTAAKKAPAKKKATTKKAAAKKKAPAKKKATTKKAAAKKKAPAKKKAGGKRTAAKKA